MFTNSVVLAFFFGFAVFVACTNLLKFAYKGYIHSKSYTGLYKDQLLRIYEMYDVPKAVIDAESKKISSIRDDRAASAEMKSFTDYWKFKHIQALKEESDKHHD